MTTSFRRVSACLLGAALLVSVAADPALSQGGVIGSSPGGLTPNSSEAAPAGGTGTLNTVRTAPTGGEVGTPRVRQRAPSRARQQARRARSRTPARAPAAQPAAAPANPNFNTDDRIGAAGTSTGSSTGPGAGPTGTAGAR